MKLKNDVLLEMEEHCGEEDVNVNGVQNQTAKITAYPEVEGDPEKGPDMSGHIGSTNNMNPKEKSNVDSPSKDPTTTNHITGGMSKTPINPNILPKSFGLDGKDSKLMSKIAQSIMPQDISIDIAECKKNIAKMIENSVNE